MELHTLPPELFCQGIFKFLTPSELLQTESVSRWWQDLCREPTLWHNYCLQEMGYPVTNTSNHNTENNIEGEKKMALDPDIEKVLPHYPLSILVFLAKCCVILLLLFLPYFSLFFYMRCAHESN